MTEMSSILKLNTCLWGTLTYTSAYSFIHFSCIQTLDLWGKTTALSKGMRADRVCVTNQSPNSFLYCGNQCRDAPT